MVIVLGIAGVGAASFVYGFIVGQTIPVSVTLTSGSPFAFYFDSAKTQPVSSIAFGSVARGQRIWVPIYVNLQASTGSAMFYWNSSLASKTSKITDYWLVMFGYPCYVGTDPFTCNAGSPAPALNQTLLESTAQYATVYAVSIGDATPQPYNWNLNCGSSA